MSQIGFTLDNMLLSCLYANQITCKSSDFKSYTSFDRGNCFTFNADISNITTSSQTGQYYGLQLELFGGFDGKGLFDFDLSDYLNLKKWFYFLDGIQNYEAISNGFYLAVTNNSNKPLIKYEGIEVSPGYVTNIGITRTFYYKLPSPYGDCRESPLDVILDSDSLYYKYTAQIGKYTRNQCYEVCFQYSYAIPMCGCADPSIGSNVNNSTICGAGPNQGCLDKQRVVFSSSKCNSDCPEACERVEYSYKVSISKYPTK